ncbi:phage integrase N-terminal SAM-like domain-containing protein [Bacillus sp. REN3]|uniref:phage integrase N-terminal SAM-like domain-containing protein n=1 Tax=Bacillus sp. REN3 TaxID=2802440 RepID=UPI001AEEC557|nr:phage integrase N-terminal SAM-like domain-containing protein [Bacillus sp. REN3]
MAQKQPTQTKIVHKRRKSMFHMVLFNRQRKQIHRNILLFYEMSEKDIQQYILYLKNERCLSTGTINNYISGIRVFYTFAIGQGRNFIFLGQSKILRCLA